MNKRDFLKTGLAWSGVALAGNRQLFGREIQPGQNSIHFSPNAFVMKSSSGNFISNPALETMAPENWQGTPLDAGGRFRNLNFPFVPAFSAVMKWKSKTSPQEKEKKSDLWKPVFRADGDFLNRNDDCLVWLGHASFFLRLNGKNILIDPVFGKATVVKRIQETPYPADVWKNIHLILVSHDHRDHCDIPSLKILARQNPVVRVLSGLGMKKLLSSVFPAGSVEEAGWYQKYQIAEPEIWYMPARHWSRRGIGDTNSRLWGSFYISGEKRLYFMGDSGMDSHFAALPRLHAAPDLALMGVGAYSPEWFMHPSHMRPEDSWKSFLELKAGKMIPMHFGTFDLSDEPASEPLRRLKAAADPEKLICPAIGETLRL